MRMPPFSQRPHPICRKILHCYTQTLSVPFSPLLLLSLVGAAFIICLLYCSSLLGDHSIPSLPPTPQSILNTTARVIWLKGQSLFCSNHAQLPISLSVKAKVLTGAYEALCGRVPVTSLPSAPSTCPFHSLCPSPGGRLTVLHHQAHAPLPGLDTVPLLESSFPRFLYGLSLTSCAPRGQCCPPYLKLQPPPHSTPASFTLLGLSYLSP